MVLVALMLFCVAVFAAPTFAKAAITANPAESPYETRGATPVDIRILASDTNAGTLSYSFSSSDHGGSMGAFTVDGSGATAAFTPGNGFAGVDNVHITVTNETTSESANVTAQVNVRGVAHFLTGANVNGASQYTNDNTPTFTFDAVTGPGNGSVSGATFSCRVDGVPVGACNSGSYTTAVLSEGPHTVSVRATTAGGTDVFVDNSFIVDTIVPGDPTLDGPSGISSLTDHTWNFTVPAENDVAQCRLITPGNSDPAWNVCAGTSKSYTGLADGQYTFEVRTRDLADNHSGVLSKNLEVDTVTDMTIGAAPADGNLDARPTIAFSSTEDPDVTYECRLYENSVAPENRPAYAACTSPFQAPFLDKNVEYRFDVRATDQATPANTADASHTWDQANTAPAIVEPDVTVEAGNQVTVTLGGSDADSDPINYAITGEVTGGTLGDIDQDNGEVIFTANDTSYGTYTFNYSVTDHRQGGVTNGTATVNVQPGTAFETVPPVQTNDVTPTWTYSSPSGLATFECNLDAGGWNACDGGSFTPGTDLAEGDHTLEVRAVAGPLADPTPVSNTITVDTTAPDVAITDQPVALSNVAAPTFDFESTDATATFECKVDAGDFAACDSGDALATLTDGNHTFTVRAVDPATNRTAEQDQATYTWEADLTNPAIEITSGLTEGKWTNLRKPTWDFSESDLNLVADSTTCTVDSQPLTNDCVGPWQPLSNLNDGNHTLTITSTDAAGNTGTKTVNFRVTTITPTAVVDSGPASPSGPSASFSFVSTTNLGDDGKFECRTRLNGGAWTTWATCPSNLSLTGLSTGNRNLEVRAVDSAGNYSTGAAVGSWTWSTIGTAPDTTITSNVINGASAAFGFTSPGTPLATFECKLDDGAWGSCAAPKTYSGLAAGSHTFSVRATNQVGTVDGSPATHTWTVGTTPNPNTFIDRVPSAVTRAAEADFEFSSSDASATFECRLDGGAWEACTSPKTLTGLAVGSHTFDVRATAGGKTDTSPDSYTWEVKARDEDPGPGPNCKPLAGQVSKSKAVVIGKGLKVSVQISHRNAIAGQTVTTKLLVNGKVAKGKLKKKAAKVLKSVDLVNAGGVENSLSLAKPQSSFTVAEDAPKRSYTVLVKRKKGKAMRSSVAFTLNSCDQ